MKNRIKNSLLIGSKASAELFLQTHHSPSLPLLPGANSIISLLCLTLIKTHSAFPSFFFSLFHAFSLIPPPLSFPALHSLRPHSFHFLTVSLDFFCSPLFIFLMHFSLIAFPPLCLSVSLCLFQIHVFPTSNMLY